jgi:hypothetical protein
VLVFHLGGPIELTKYLMRWIQIWWQTAKKRHFKCCQHLFILTRVRGQSMGP